MAAVAKVVGVMARGLLKVLSTGAKATARVVKNPKGRGATLVGGGVLLILLATYAFSSNVWVILSGVLLIFVGLGILFKKQIRKQIRKRSKKRGSRGRKERRRSNEFDQQVSDIPDADDSESAPGLFDGPAVPSNTRANVSFR